MPPGSRLSCLSFLSGRPSEPPCVSTAISGSSLPFMCGGPDRLSPISPTTSTTHTWDTLSVVCHHNGIQQAFSRGTTAYSPPFNSTLKCIHSSINGETQTHTHAHTHAYTQNSWHWNTCTTHSNRNHTAYCGLKPKQLPLKIMMQCAKLLFNLWILTNNNCM